MAPTVQKPVVRVETITRVTLATELVREVAVRDGQGSSAYQSKVKIDYCI